MKLVVASVQDCSEEDQTEDALQSRVRGRIHLWLSRNRVSFHNVLIPHDPTKDIGTCLKQVVDRTAKDSIIRLNLGSSMKIRCAFASARKVQNSMGQITCLIL